MTAQSLPPNRPLSPSGTLPSGRAAMAGPHPVAGMPAAAAGATFTLGDLIAAILRHKLLVLALTLAGALGGFVVAKRITPSYGAEAALISDPSIVRILESPSGDSGGMLDPSVTPTIVETVGAPVVLERALQALPPELRAGLAEEAGIAAEIAKAAEPDRAALEDALLRQHLSNNLEVTNSGRSYVVHVAYASPDAELSAAIANATAAAYLDYRSELKRNSSSVVLESLSTEITTLKSGLQAAERTAQAMRERVRLLAARSEALTGRQQDQAIEENSGLYAHQREAEREAEAMAAVYERLLLTQREIQSRVATPELDVQLFAPAPVPLHPSGFNVKPLLLVLGLVAGFCLGASTALLRERWMTPRRRRRT